MKKIVDWVLNGEIVSVNYPDFTESILADIIDKESNVILDKKPLGKKKFSFRLFRNVNFLKKIKRTSFKMF